MGLRAGILIFGLLSGGELFADVKDADNSESRFRQYWTDRFTTFTQEQNVAGLGSRPDGKSAVGGKKNRPNKDDGYQYEGYLTYHDLAFNTVEEISKPNPSNPQDPKSKESRTLYGFISKHGGLSAAGGSSLLERTVYQQHEKFTKEQEELRKNGKPVDDEKTGTSYKSVFQVDTQKVIKDPAKPDETEKIERWKLRKEVKDEVVKVGEESFQTIEAAARDKGFENDENTLPNSTLLYEAAGRAYDAWWNSTQANLGQLRANRAIRGGPKGIRAQLDEDVANCEDWAKETRQKLAQSDSNRSAQQTEKDDKELDRMLSQCKEMVRTSYKAVDPDFEKDSKDGSEKLSNGGAEKENARERDLRAQLEVLNDPQKRLDEIDTNWNYGESDAKSKVTISYDENGRNPVEADATVKERVDSYNAKLETVAESFDRVKKLLPTITGDSKTIKGYQIKDRRSAKDLSALPDSIYEEDTGVEKPKAPTPKNYSELVSKTSKK